MDKKNKGVVLITAYLIIAVLLVLCSAFLMRNVWIAKSAERYKENLAAFYLAEAGLDKALAKLPSDTTNETAVALGTGQYSLTISTQVAGKEWIATGYGYVPTAASPRATRIVEAYIKERELSNNFWGQAIYTAGNITTVGNKYDVNGNILYAGDENIAFEERVNGNIVEDPSINPLARLNFESLKLIAESQTKTDGSGNVYDNVYTAAEIAAQNPPLPASFYYNAATGTPNVVYIEDDLILNGDLSKYSGGGINQIGGFIIVVGDVINTPDVTQETIINGNGQIDGCVYTTGQFRVNGGGNGLNVFGGVWAGSDGVRLSGTTNITYNEEYMNAIKNNLPTTTQVQVMSWREVR